MSIIIEVNFDLVLARDLGHDRRQCFDVWSAQQRFRRLLLGSQILTQLLLRPLRKLQGSLRFFITRILDRLPACLLSGLLKAGQKTRNVLKTEARNGRHILCLQQKNVVLFSACVENYLQPTWLPKQNWPGTSTSGVPRVGTEPLRVLSVGHHTQAVLAAVGRSPVPAKPSCTAVCLSTGNARPVLQQTTSSKATDFSWQKQPSNHRAHSPRVSLNEQVQRVMTSRCSDRKADPMALARSSDPLITENGNRTKPKLGNKLD